MKIKIEIEILREVENEDEMGYYAKGHWLTARFFAAVVRFGGRLDGLAVPKWTYYRVVPMNGPDGLQSQFVETSKPGPGAFAVTVSERY